MLYDASHVKDNCGFGLIAHLQGEASHKIVRTALHALSRMQHRGAILADGKSVDGCGLLLQKPDRFLRLIAEQQGWSLAPNYAVGMFFLSHDPKLAALSRQIIEQELQKEMLTLVGWRQVPVHPDVLGEIARSSMPDIVQLFVNSPVGWRSVDLQRRLYVARRRIEKRIEDNAFYICSFSSRTIVYKGLCNATDLPRFYPDLADMRLESAICLFHQRFSTNTTPRWPLAQPFRYLAHNGEINTITANRQWARARTYKFRTPLIPDLHDAAPYVNETGSDSSSLDNMLELLLSGGMDLVRAMRLLVPPAWNDNPQMDDKLRAFFDFNSMHMEPWDGPAGIVLSDGRYAACNLDRNGLRPARYVLTQDQLLTCASEVGIWDYSPDEVLEKGRVGPGELLVIDTRDGKIYHSSSSDNDLKNRHPYLQWMHKNVKRLTPAEELPPEALGSPQFDAATLLCYQKQFAWSREELETMLLTLARESQEPTGSMGDDTPLAVLSCRPRLLYDYFRQQFAQVTNPPIDPLRESHVMSLSTSIGREMNVFHEAEGQAHRINFKSPLLLPSDLQQLLSQDPVYYRHSLLDLSFDPEQCSLEEALIQLCEQGVQLAREGTVLLLLSDRNISRHRLPIPAAMAVGALQAALVRENLRCDSNIIVKTASTRDPHHFAVLLGLGATAIYPYLAYESLAQLCQQGILSLPWHQAIINYRNGINKGLYKIMSKMGISIISSYRCANLFEAIGFDHKLSRLCFPLLRSPVGGAGFADFQQELQQLAHQAWNPTLPLPAGGLLKYRHNDEYHAYNPDVVQALQKAVQSNELEDYRHYADLVNQRPPLALRDLLALKPPAQPVPLHQVEAPETLFPRFDTAAMSIGALSPEAHEALALAMNQLGGCSNSGEGGEDPVRYGTNKVSRIKQVASGRFGVTPSYLVNADVIQIKVAQGAKPGEGGQLPGDKVTPYIAKLRFAVPGLTLISPPPHHDIYSIEDLAQLIFDLKQVNSRAMISVKLVSGPGVGTIATGVAKAYADMITIAGHDGGTGASPLTSVKYAGTPWELGLVETQQALVANGLRHKVRLQVDGGLKTGLDVVKAAILGAESFGFGTGPMIALGCKYLRICHLNNCATGIATQHEQLRASHYHGLPERVMHYFHFIAHETREIMAQLGVCRLVDLIGRTDLLRQLPGITPKQQKLDLTSLLVSVPPINGNTVWHSAANPCLDKGTLNQHLLQQALESVQQQQSQTLFFTIRNTDRAVGAALSGEVSRLYGARGVADHPIKVHFTGTAGQSFAVWNAAGIELHLTGDANDYVGKGMAGGCITLKPPGGSPFAAHMSQIIGNTCLYGATGGRLFAAGRAGERFAVRNSGAISVVEGLGDNGCEYMTGGIVVVLGATGVNFAAGMTGGIAFVLDKSGQFSKKVNPQYVELLTLHELPAYQQLLQHLLRQHSELTGSEQAESLLRLWSNSLPHFVLVKPKAADLEALWQQAQTLCGHCSGAIHCEEIAT
ncbi:MAG: glutamate synthase large subunit [Enterobacteriaceae bacterium]